MMFERLSFGGKPLSDEASRIVLDVSQEYGVKDIETIHGQGKRRPMSLTKARYEMWRRMNASGFKQSEIADMFGVTRAAVSIGLKRIQKDPAAISPVCPCCGRAFAPAFGRGG